jgi:hypothetical protein
MVSLNELIEYHRTQAMIAKGPAVGWGGGAPGDFVARQKYRFHGDAVELLEQVLTSQTNSNHLNQVAANN